MFFSWEDSLFLWQSSIVTLVITGRYIPVAELITDLFPTISKAPRARVTHSLPPKVPSHMLCSERVMVEATWQANPRDTLPTPANGETLSTPDAAEKALAQTSSDPGNYPLVMSK